MLLSSGVVTSWLTPTVVTAANAGAVSAAQTVGMYAGAFAGGATAGALNAAAYGGNVWQSALYGGLMGAAIAGTIQGALELANILGNSPTATGDEAGGTGETKPAFLQDRIKGGSPLLRKQLEITNPFGVSHTAIDAAGYLGEPIQATGKSFIVFQGVETHGANVVAAYSFESGVTTAYVHSRPNVSVGMVVNKGDIIGFIDMSGRTSGPHLHLSTSIGPYWTANRFNPLDYFQIFEKPVLWRFR